MQQLPSVLACALENVCRDGYTVHYARVPRLFTDLAHGDGRFARLFRMLVRVDLLILDDRGPDRLSASQRRDLMETRIATAAAPSSSPVNLP
jgi:DNA replication protein DnaC